jgi:hypothetical protein
MQKALFRFPTSIARLFLLGAGCAGQAPQGASQATPSVPKGRSSACSHPYYPLAKGYAVEYQTTTGGKVFSYSTRVTEQTGESIKLVNHVNQIDVEQTINCSGGSLRAEGYADLGSALKGQKITTETKSVSGEMLPKDLHVGSSWDTDFHVILHGIASFGDADATITATHKALAEESVTVPAGTYTALKVETKTTIVMKIQSLGDLPPITIATTEWWVKGVGLVKTKTAAVASEGDSITEATKVTLP